MSTGPNYEERGWLPSATGTNLRMNRCDRMFAYLEGGYLQVVRLEGKWDCVNETYDRGKAGRNRGVRFNRRR